MNNPVQTIKFVCGHERRYTLKDFKGIALGLCEAMLLALESAPQESLTDTPPSDEGEAK